MRIPSISAGSIVFNSLVTGLLFTVLLILSFFFLVRPLKKEVKRVSGLLKNMSQGDLTHNVEIKRSSAFDTLLTNLNSLTMRFRGLVAQVNAMADKTTSYASELNQDARKVNHGSKEMASVVNDIAKSMEEQMAQINHAESYSYEVIDSAKKIASKSESVKQKANNTIATINASNSNFQTLIEKLDMTAKSSLETISRIRELEKQTYLIQSIADHVSKISESTNMLALNASIEAARAGEAGKGFAVVASEVRKLAEDSTEQAKQIQKVVNGIKTEILDITSGMEKETRTIQENIDFSRITKEYLNKINTETKETFDAFGEIDIQLEDQADKIDKVVKIIESTSHTFEGLAAATQELAASTEEQADTTETIFNRLTRLVDMNKEIEQYIGGFVQAYRVDDKLQRQIDKAVSALGEIAKTPGLSAMDYRTCTPILKEKQAAHPYFELLAALQKDGMRKAVNLDLPEQQVYASYAHRPYFKEAIEGKTYMSKPYISVDTNNYCIAMSVPVRNAAGEITGVLLGDLKL